MIEEKTREICNLFYKNKDNLIPILDEVQKEFSCIPNDSILIISEYLEIKKQEIYGIVKYYNKYKLEDSAKYIITICTGISCSSKSSQKLIEKAEEILNIKVGEKTKDNLFELKTKNCFKKCGTAPNFRINEIYYQNATEKVLTDEIEKIKNKEKGNSR